MTTVVMQATSDTYIIQDNLTWAGASSAKYLTVTGTGGGSQRLAFLYFNRPFPLGASIVSATLRLYQKGAASGGARELQVRNVAAAWQESKLRFNNAPGVRAVSANSGSQGNGGADGRVWEIDVTAHMQEISDGAAWYGFRIASTNTTMMYLFSSKSDVFQPSLEVEWADEPDVPSVLSPAGGRAVSLARPTLRTDFVDHGGDTSIAGIHIQMNADEVPTGSPDVDTGDVATAEPQWTVDFDIDADAVWWWRAEVIDGAGLRSGWSDWVSFTRTAKPTVTITNPTAGTVSEATPPISWTVSETQVAYQVFITDPADPATVLWTTGKVSSSATTATVADAVLAPGAEYGLTVRVWDEAPREATPGDPPYTDVSTTFTFELSSDVDPVTDLVVVASTDSPAVTLRWERADAPDSYTILRDGVPIAANVLPVDTITSGTSNEWVDAFPSPRREHVWQVLAVVNGATSDDNPEDMLTTRPKGVWLSTLDGSLSVCLSGDGDNPAVPSVEPNEVSSVDYPLGADYPVVRTQSLYQRKGEVSGSLGPAPLSELDGIADVWAALVRRRSEPLSLVAADAGMKVQIYNTWTGLLDESTDWNGAGFIDVGFSYVQVG